MYYVFVHVHTFEGVYDIYIYTTYILCVNVHDNWLLKKSFCLIPLYHG